MFRQIFSQEVPFHPLNKYQAEKEVISNNGRPPRPSQDNLEWGLTDEVWNLIQNCWVRNPADRKSIDEVVTEIENIRHQMDMLNNLEVGNAH